MKKKLCLMMALCMLLAALTACSAQDAATTAADSTAAPASAEATTEQKTDAETTTEAPEETEAVTQAEETTEAEAPVQETITLDNIRNYVVGVEEPVELSDGTSRALINFDNAATTPAFRPVMQEVDGRLENPVDPARVKAFMEKVRELRGNN